MKTMKLLTCVICLLALVFAGCAGDSEQPEGDLAIPLGDTGVTVILPSDVGFEEQVSQRNDYFGTSASGEWCIIVNAEEKGSRTLTEYANATSQANGVMCAQIGRDGNYYFTYANESEGYHFYVAVREGAEKYYRVAFYCNTYLWDNYREDFAKWAATVEVA